MALPWRSTRYIRSLLTSNGACPNSKCATPSASARLTPSAKTKQRSTSNNSTSSSPAPDSASPAVAYVNPNIGRLAYSNAGALGADQQLRQTLLQTGSRALETVCTMSTIPMMEALHDEQQQQRANQQEDQVVMRFENKNLDFVGNLANNHSDEDLLHHRQTSESEHSDGQRAMNGRGETNGHLVNSTNLAGFKAQHQHHPLLGDVDASGSKFSHVNHHLTDDEDHVVDSENEFCPLDPDPDHEDHDLPPGVLAPCDLTKQKEIERLMNRNTESCSSRIFQHLQRRHADQQLRQRANTNPNDLNHSADTKQPRSHSPTPVPIDNSPPKRPTFTVARTSEGEDEDDPFNFSVRADGVAHPNDSAGEIL